MILGAINLNEHFERLSKLTLKNGIEKGISLVQETAKAYCPVYDGELRSKIESEVIEENDFVQGICWPAVTHGMYVELGTGPKGQANHAGISPNITVAYTQSPWWIHESQISRETAEHYHFFHIDTPQGRFYQCTGQPAQPYLYPALKDNVDEIMDIVAEEVKKQL